MAIINSHRMRSSSMRIADDVHLWWSQMVSYKEIIILGTHLDHSRSCSDYFKTMSVLFPDELGIILASLGNHIGVIRRSIKKMLRFFTFLLHTFANIYGGVSFVWDPKTNPTQPHPKIRDMVFPKDWQIQLVWTAGWVGLVLGSHFSFL